MDLSSEDQRPAILVGHSPELSEASTPSNGRQSFRAITHLAVLTAFILPVALLPYVLSRRRLSSLHRVVDRMETDIKMLQQNLSRASTEIATRKDENQRMRVLLHQLMQETGSLRTRTKQKDAAQQASDETVRSDLRMLLDERRHARLVLHVSGIISMTCYRCISSRRTQTAALRALGTSLADVAAFMHEVELEIGLLSQGTDQRGVDRLRLLAFRMASLPRQPESKVIGYESSSFRACTKSSKAANDPIKDDIDA